MSNSVKTVRHKVTVGLRKEDVKMLKTLCEIYSDNQGSVMRRALNYFYIKCGIINNVENNGEQRDDDGSHEDKSENIDS
jgi:hypothetical protein